jgi:diguanylate cyclase (GGDEF)-like protein
MSRRHIGIYGCHDESLRLARLLSDAADVEVVRYFDSDPERARACAQSLGHDFAEEFDQRFHSDLASFVGQADLAAVVDDGRLESFLSRAPEATDHGTQVVSPLTARLLWGYGTAPRDRKTELLQALAEVVESVELTIDSDELFRRMLEIAVSITGAEGGSLMLLAPETRDLHIKVAIGVEEELWPKIRVPLGEGIAGHVAETARSLHLEGKADRRDFHILRERLDVESAICVPLVQDGRVLGVLNLHHATRPGAFSEEDLRFIEELAGLDSQIIRRAQEHETLRNQAARYEAVREIHGMLSGPAPLADRLESICKRVADRMGNGIANIYLRDPERESDELLLTATSLAGGGFGGEYRIISGQGVDGGAAASRRPAFLRGERGCLAYAALPLLVGDRLVGVLAAQAGSNPPHGRAAEEGLLEIAAAVAEGVARTRREAHIRARATRMSAINETGIRMLSATHVDEMARLATSSLAMILDADHVVLRLQDRETRRYRVASYYGSADEALQPRLFALDKQMSVEAIKRRTVFLVREISAHPGLESFASDFSSLIAAPLKIDGQVIGTVAIYDKVAIDRFFVGRFNDEDLQVFAKFISYVERATENAEIHAAAERHSNFDSDTGLPNQSYLDARLREEIVRASGRTDAVTVASCQIENGEAIEAASNPAHAHRVLLATAEALREEVRDFDVVARTSPHGFTVMLPEPGTPAGDRITQLARRVTDRICRDEALNAPMRIELAFGHAHHPADGDEPAALCEAANEPRIRMV